MPTASGASTSPPSAGPDDTDLEEDPVDSLVSLLADAGLTGRGGAAFSTATKLEAARAHRAQLVVNACDGELGAAKDGWVVERHLAELVEGARLVAGRRRVRYAARGRLCCSGARGSTCSRSRRGTSPPRRPPSCPSPTVGSRAR
jgi:hypothetical protein